jgi:hypothetical protein
MAMATALDIPPPESNSHDSSSPPGSAHSTPLHGQPGPGHPSFRRYDILEVLKAFETYLKRLKIHILTLHVILGNEHHELARYEIYP